MPPVRPIVMLAALLAVALPAAEAGHARPPEIPVGITATGPGVVTVDGFMTIRDSTVSYITTSRMVSLVPAPDGNGAEFRGWAGDCASSGAGPCVISGIGCASADLFVCSATPRGSGPAPEPCRWTAALFAPAGQPTPTVANPCAPDEGQPGEGPGDSPGQDTPGGSPAPSGAPRAMPDGAGSGSPSAGVAPRVSPPALRRTRTRVTATTVIARGRYPAGTTRVVQSLVRVGAPGVSIRGRCRMRRVDATFTCTSPRQRGRWKVTTQARRGGTVLAQSTATVTVR